MLYHCNTTPPASFLSLPSYAQEALEILESSGFEAWIVGGYVRDSLLGLPGSDIDIATVADWHDTQHIFEQHGWHTHKTGVAHGTLSVCKKDSKTKQDSKSCEITTYRSDGIYCDARHPRQVTFVRTIEEDLARRDFTINALAYHPARGILDLWGGMDDLKSATIRAVGEPTQRFSEDALRILRACRLCSQLGFVIDLTTLQGMSANKNLLGQISVERITCELNLLLLGKFVRYAFLQTIEILEEILPELKALQKPRQANLNETQQYPLHHIEKTLEHTLRVIENTPAQLSVRWAVLFHHLARALTSLEDKTNKIDKGSARASCKDNNNNTDTTIAYNIMKRLSFSATHFSQILKLVEYYDIAIEPTPKAIKCILVRLNGDVELFRALCALGRAEALSEVPPCSHRVETLDKINDILADILASNEAFSYKQLAIDGREVMALGIPQGPLVGEALSAALNAVIDGTVTNDPVTLRVYIRQWFEKRR